MGPSVSTREEIVLVQMGGEFGSLTKRCVRYRREAVRVLLGTQYGSQCESKTGECFGPNEREIWVHDKDLCELKERGCMSPDGEAIWVPV